MSELNGGDVVRSAQEILKNPDRERPRIVSLKISIIDNIANVLNDEKDITSRQSAGDLVGAQELRSSLRHSLFERFRQAQDITSDNPIKKIPISQIEYELIMKQLRDVDTFYLQDIGHKKGVIMNVEDAFAKGKRASSEEGMSARLKKLFKRK